MGAVEGTVVVIDQPSREICFNDLAFLSKPENGNNGECVDGGGDAEPGGRVKNPETFFYPPL